MSASIVCFAPDSVPRKPPDADILGGKGANLVSLCKIGLPVPPGFILGTDFARHYEKKGRIDGKLVDAVRDALSWLQETSGRQFGSRRTPLLLAVRSGAPTSMPGMMDTILNIGLNDDTVDGLERLSGNPRFAWDSYRRLIGMYGDSVFNIPRSVFEEILSSAKEAEGVEYDWELDATALEKVTKALRKRISECAGTEFPQDPEAQLYSAIEAVFASWDSDRARAYRAMHSIENTGTAVTVQSMVFGNCGASSGSGVAFTRNPSTGENRLYAEFLYNAQGEDVVSGSRIPESGEALEKGDPDVHRQIRSIAQQLERHFRDMQDIEFTIEDGKLYILQVRNAKRSPLSALRIATEMVEEGLLTVEEALDRLEGIPPEQFKVRRLLPPDGSAPIARGIVASAGIAVGEVALDSAAAIARRSDGRNVILVREETQPEDVEGMQASVGLLTARGGTTSHAAVVARQLGVCCIVGCEALRYHADGSVTLGDMPLTEGRTLSLDGYSASVYTDAVPVATPEESREMHLLRKWAEEAGARLPF